MFYVASLLLTRSDRGATAAEYAILASLIAVAIIGAVTFLGLSLESLFDDPELLGAFGSEE